MNPAIGFIGVGEIASAIVDGLCSPQGPAPEVFLSPRNATIADDLARRHRNVEVCSDNQEVVDRAPIVILAVRPSAISAVLEELQIADDRIVISAVAGITYEELRRHLGQSVALVRAIPLPAVRQRHGITAIHPAHPEVEQLFEDLGGALVVDDAETLTAIQATTAAISTHLHYLATVATWLAELGIAHPDAEHYVRAMFLGVADALSDRARTLPDLALAHETPEGINEQFRRTWFTEETRTRLRDALKEVHARLTH